jgi:putative ABC transport system permease protein
MQRARRVPLAWLNLTHDPRRFLVSLAGVSFAVVLMFVEVGFYNALLDSTAALIGKLNGDLFVISKAKSALIVPAAFARRFLTQTLSFDGVRDAAPVYLESRFSFYANPADRSTHPIRVIACDLAREVLDFPEIRAARDELQLSDRALIDARSKSDYGPLPPPVPTELSGHRVLVVGTFELGTDFANDGNLFMSEGNFIRYFPRGNSAQESLGQVDIGVLRLDPRADRSAVQQALRGGLPDAVEVLTRDEFRDREQRFWTKTSPIGYVFGLGAAIGFIVGVVICYQVLATDVADHETEYATLKAIGYANGYLRGVVMQQAILLSLVGFVPGLVCSWLLYAGLAYGTGLPMDLTLLRGLLVLGFTIIMCALSGLIALRKVQTLDPAEVF